ncbi:hypothetical protein FOA52_007213 [Chlamydomonas sp. UWO 241]|nr:hypothetical protein FOA52_007213 [Chlamydomonas sp. UWO 241]
MRPAVLVTCAAVAALALLCHAPPMAQAEAPHHRSLGLATFLATLAYVTPQILGDAAVASQAAQHTSNWAVIVDTSLFWLNYRHESNALSHYHTAKRLGIPDSNIILMIAHDMACNAKNPYPARVYGDKAHDLNLYDDTVEVDYRGSEVNVENFLRLLIGRHDPASPRSKRLLSDEGSNVFVFLNGHGGDDFVKFQDVQELMGQDLADALQHMHEKGRYNELLLFVESCEAGSMIEKITAPNIVATGSSVKGQSSYSYDNDYLLGMPVSDAFTWRTLKFTERIGPGSKATLPDLFKKMTYDALKSNFTYRTTALRRPLSSMRLTDFLGSATRVAAGAGEAYPLSGRGACGEARAGGGGGGGGGGILSELWSLHATGGI